MSCCLLSAFLKITYKFPFFFLYIFTTEFDFFKRRFALKKTFSLTKKISGFYFIFQAVFLHYKSKIYIAVICLKIYQALNA